MWGEIRAKRDAMAKRYKKSLRHTIQVDYIAFMDELAEPIGCKPDISKLENYRYICGKIVYAVPMSFVFGSVR